MKEVADYSLFIKVAQGVFQRCVQPTLGHVHPSEMCTFRWVRSRNADDFFRQVCQLSSAPLQVRGSFGNWFANDSLLGGVLKEK